MHDPCAPLRDPKRLTSRGVRLPITDSFFLLFLSRIHLLLLITFYMQYIASYYNEFDIDNQLNSEIFE